MPVFLRSSDLAVQSSSFLVNASLVTGRLTNTTVKKNDGTQRPAGMIVETVARMLPLAAMIIGGIVALASFTVWL